MNINKEIKPYTDLATKASMTKAINLAKEWLAEPIEHVIPDIQLSGDGLRLHSFVLVTENYIAESRINELNIDIVRISTITSYRVEVGEFKTTINSKPYVCPMATVTLLHDISMGTTTEIHFFGNDFDPWFKIIKQALPTDILNRHT